MKDKVKKHIHKYRWVYGSLSVAAIAVGTFYLGRRIGLAKGILSATVIGDGVNAVGSVIENSFNTTVHNGGTMTKVIRELTGSKDIWMSMTDCASSTGIRLSDLSKHINGYPGFETVNGRRFEVIALAAGLVNPRAINMN